MLSFVPHPIHLWIAWKEASLSVKYSKLELPLCAYNLWVPSSQRNSTWVYEKYEKSIYFF
jgi:hypothetical protein